MGKKRLGVGIELKGLRKMLKGCFLEGRVVTDDTYFRTKKDWRIFRFLFGWLFCSHNESEGKMRIF
jgi:hypothetical protein